MGFFILADDSVNKLKVVRAMREVTQAELSAVTGIGQVRLSRIESGSVIPTASEERAIASALGVEPALLFEPRPEAAGV